MQEGYGVLIQGVSNGFIVNYTIPRAEGVKAFVFPDFQGVLNWLKTLPISRGQGKDE